MRSRKVILGLGRGGLRLQMGRICLLVFLSGCLLWFPGCGDACDPYGVEKSYDLSDFDEFELQLVPGLWVGPDEDDMISGASITKQEDGQYLLQISVVVDPDDPVGEELPQRFLTQTEVDEMKQVFSAVGITTTSDFRCCISYAWFYDVRWDDWLVTGGPSCSGYELDYMRSNATSEIVEFIESLRE